MTDDDLTIDKMMAMIDRVCKPTEFEIEGHKLNWLDYDERPDFAPEGKRLFIRKDIGRYRLDTPRFAFLLIDPVECTVLTNPRALLFDPKMPL